LKKHRVRALNARLRGFLKATLKVLPLKTPKKFEKTPSSRFKCAIKAVFKGNTQGTTSKSLKKLASRALNARLKVFLKATLKVLP